MTQDEQQLDLLAIFHYVVGALTALFSSVFLIHVAMGIVLLCTGFEGEHGPPRIFGLFLILFPGLFVLFGWSLGTVIIVAGLKLKRRVSRMFCLVVAGVECTMMPFGTVLGVFTLVVLMRESVKTLFSAETDGGENQIPGRPGTGRIKLRGIQLSSAQPEVSKAFYGDLLGLPVSIDKDGLKSFESGWSGLDLDVVLHESGQVTVSFIVDNVDGYLDMLRNKEIEVTEPASSQLGMRAISLTDPDGRRVVIQSPTDKSPAWLRDMVA